MSNYRGGYGNNNNNDNISSVPSPSQDKLSIEFLDRSKVLLTGTYQMFSGNLKRVIDSLDGKWNSDYRGWIIPLRYLEILIKTISKERMMILVESVPRFINQILTPLDGPIQFSLKGKAVTISYPPNDLVRNVDSLPVKLTKNLYFFQKMGIQFGCRNHGRVLIADEMGVGKTIQALGLACIYEAEWPFLVICPSSLRLNWKDEILKWVESITVGQIQVVTKLTEKIRSNIRVLIISYDLASKMCDTLEELNFKVCIADEAHYLKSAEAKRTQNLVPIFKRSKRCILLTGTPAFAKPKELFTLISMIRPDAFDNFNDFGVRYCEPTPSQWSKGMDYNGSTKSAELHFILMDSMVIRRLKKDVLGQLPTKIRQRIEVETEKKYIDMIQAAMSKTKDAKVQMTETINTLMDAQFQASEMDYESQVIDFDNQTNRVAPQLFECYKNTGMAKLEGIKKYIRDLSQNDIKMLIFAHHKDVLDGIEEEVKKLDTGYIRIDGSIGINKRHDLVKAFQENEHIKIAVLSLTAASVGITLTAASTVIFAEMYWTPAVILQAEDRIHRVGQKSKTSVNYHYLYGEDTLDSLMYAVLQNKLTIVSKILEGRPTSLDIINTRNSLGDFNANTRESIKNEDAYMIEENAITHSKSLYQSTSSNIDFTQNNGIKNRENFSALEIKPKEKPINTGEGNLGLLRRLQKSFNSENQSVPRTENITKSTTQDSSNPYGTNHSALKATSPGNHVPTNFHSLYKPNKSGEDNQDNQADGNFQQIAYSKDDMVEETDTLENINIKKNQVRTTKSMQEPDQKRDFRLKLPPPIKKDVDKFADQLLELLDSYQKQTQDKEDLG